MIKLDRRVCIAPMMDRTDRHFRYLMRLISQHTVLYTEMLTTGALLHGDRDNLLRYNLREHPVALQLGGSEPEALAACARLAEQWGYDEVNLNVGCPSDRVQSGRFGACLMVEPQLVAEGVAAMRAVTSLPVTVKTRLGIDQQDRYEFLLGFIDTVRQARCDTFILHARKAWLSGLSPKENRNVPPLDYSAVYRLKADCPDLQIVINGGFSDLGVMVEQLRYVDGVMVGREAYANPYLFATVDRLLFDSRSTPPSRPAVVRQYADYLRSELARGTPLKAMTRHVLGLFQGQPGARAWRRYISENQSQVDRAQHILESALEAQALHHAAATAP
jgi:tRNA-dihydrouridine synthase A